MITVDLTVTYERSEVVDFSITLYKAKRTLMALSNTNRNRSKQFFSIIQKKIYRDEN